MAKFQLNGREVTVASEDDTPLLWVVRDELGLIGSKFGCGAAQCGACTMYLEGQPIRSCVTAVSDVDGKSVTTIEGLSGPWRKRCARPGRNWTSCSAAIANRGRSWPRRRCFRRRLLLRTMTSIAR